MPRFPTRPWRTPGRFTAPPDDGAGDFIAPREVAPASLPISLAFILLGLGPLALNRAGAPARPLVAWAILIWALGVIALAIVGINQITADEAAAKSSEGLLAFLAASPLRLGGAVYLALVAALFPASAIARYLGEQSVLGYSLFHSFFSIVALISAGFSALTSFLGVRIIFESETESLFSSFILPFGLSLFIFVYALALWIGGSDLVRRQYWAERGFGAFLERLLKWLILALPGIGLFVLSTWTSALGLGGRDAIRIHYTAEVARLLADCEATAQFRAREDDFLANLEITVKQLRELSAQERERGVISGVAGAGDVVNYVERLSAWLALITQEASGLRDGGELAAMCEKSGDSLLKELGKIGGTAFKPWERRFIDRFDTLRTEINEARTKGSPIGFVGEQVAAMETKVVRPELGPSPTAQSLRAAIDRYAERVHTALSALISKYGASPPAPLPPTAVWGVGDLFDADGTSTEGQSASTVPGLAVISARGAIWQYGDALFDIWAFALVWDFASYLLMIVYILFPQVGFPRRSP